jgi:hypothetical protein
VKNRLCLNIILACLAAAFALPAAADIVYENGPINGETDGWTINFGFVISDTITISTGNTKINGLSFGVWLTPGDVVQSLEVSITSSVQGGTVYFDGMLDVTQSGCYLNSYSYDICTETAMFDGPVLANGMYWLNLENAESEFGDPVYWDENSGVGCYSPGCPSYAAPNSLGTLPSEAFTIYGTPVGTGTVPEPAGLMLLASGIVSGWMLLRRKMQ